jgi:outer membrane protein OmpA-like peptidoglycan-associated protein
MIKLIARIVAITMMCSLIASCGAMQNANRTQKGAAGGAAGGALIGGLLGGGVKGVLIGAAIGGAAGGLIGNSMDKQADKIEEAVPGAEVERVGEGIQIVFDEKSGVNFAFNSADLTATAKTNLNAVAEVFLEFPDTDLLIEGHTDSVGDAGYNMDLSRRRAQAVADYMQSQGVSSSRVTVKALGETSPRFDNATKEGQAKNRRVEVGVVANEQMIEDAKAQSN